MQQKQRIVLIEDDEFDHNMLSDYLNAKGYDVISVRDATRAFEQIEQAQPNVIFTALMLNDFIGGDEIVEKLRADANFKAPIVGMSSQVNAAAEYFYSLCDYQLAKPITISNISQIIKKIFG